MDKSRVSVGRLWVNCVEKHNFNALVFVAVVFVSLLLFYTAYDKESKTLVWQKLFGVLLFSDFSKSLSEFNKIFALSAIGLISFSLIAGPLSKMFPKHFAHYLPMRKFVGLSGFAFALAHSIYSLVIIYKLDFGKMFFSNTNILGIVSAIIAVVIFLLMSITSTRTAVQKMGYHNWKLLQTTGYAALFFSILHFVLLETKPGKGLDVRPFGLLFLALEIIALAIRAGTAIIRTKPRTGFEEHVGEKPQKIV